MTREEFLEIFSVGLVVGGSIVIPHLRRAMARLEELDGSVPLAGAPSARRSAGSAVRPPRSGPRRAPGADEAARPGCSQAPATANSGVMHM